ncbi:MAG TPA: DNA/RNA non-specific endonuclease [Pyrinomonadaceae bacterium]|nr:DNA/RNA non-specific endonuclease [Pyrinomonadaceae bacterium]
MNLGSYIEFRHAVIFLAILCLNGCGRIAERLNTEQNRGSNAATGTASSESVHLLFGNPSNATADPKNRGNYLLIGRSSALSYNNRRGTLNWVAWRTTRDDLGEKLERPDFEPDPRLPRGFTRIVHSDYTGSGYERGHMVPSADRFGNVEENAETFYMTNIVPQTADVNEFVWQKLEVYARAIVRRGADLYTIAGVYGDAGRLKDRVTVPTNCWTIIVVLPAGGALTDINENTRVIAVDMPDIDGIRNDNWRKYRASVRMIEQKTGYTFFDKLSPDLQNSLKNTIDSR